MHGTVMRRLDTTVVCGCHSHCASVVYVMVAGEGFGEVEFLGYLDTPDEQLLAIHIDEGLIAEEEIKTGSY